MTSYREALLVGAIRIGANVLMIGALFLAMYLASRSTTSSMLTFCGSFFGITIPLWILAIALTKYVRRKANSAMKSVILLPGNTKPTLVEWKVIER